MTTWTATLLKHDIPEFRTEVASVVSRNATSVDYDSEDDETYAGKDLHRTKDKFDLSLSALSSIVQI